MSDPSMLALQRRFREVALGGAASELASLVDGRRVPAEARLRIYRHHVATSLVAALGATFSSVEALVGAAFFTTMARAYVLASPPAGPVLTEYGDGFADHVAAWEPARSLPYLADVARLDRALTLAYNADPGVALDAAALAAIGPDELETRPLHLRVGTSVLRSAFPVDRIWMLAMGRTDAAETIDAAAGAVDLVVFQRDDDAAFQRVGAGDAAWLRACGDGLPLGEAIAAAAEADAGFDLGAALTVALAVGWLAASAATPRIAR